jgi:phi LC3 family holin
MKINWKVRLRNKIWLSSAMALIVSFVYDLLAMLEVVPAISEDWLMSLIQTVLTMLTMLGVIIDPTTQGASDSDRAMLYDEPGHLPDETDGIY